MKKKTIIGIILLLALMLTSCATLSKTNEDVGVLQEIATFEGQTEDELYTKARSWFVESFNSSEAVIEQQDRTEHIIKGKYSDKVARNMFCNLIYESIITVEIKSERVRFSVSAPINAYTQTGADRLSADKYTTAEVEEINIKRQALYESFKSYLSTEREDW